VPQGKSISCSRVMQVSVLEAGLQAMCAIYGDEVKRTSVYRRKRFRKKRDRILEFSLNELINIAREVQCFPPRIISWGKRIDLAGFAHEVRKIRNSLCKTHRRELFSEVRPARNAGNSGSA